MRRVESRSHLKGNDLMPAVSRQRGVSLIEVLMAVLIFSVGLLGVAGLMVMATRSNHSAYQRTQAIFLADSMADRMSANPVGVWSGFYETPGSYASLGSAENDCSAGCTPKELAEADLRIWRRQLITLLPNDETTWGTIRCYNGPAGYAPKGWTPATDTAPADRGQLAMRPPYGGMCWLYVRWNERAHDGMVRTFVRTFQP